jgi:hypothetical protein
MKRKEELLFLKKKKQKDFFDFGPGAFALPSLWTDSENVGQMVFLLRALAPPCC